jgi:phage baseplate assembly protein W
MADNLTLGTDFGGLLDISPAMTMVSGRKALGQALARRLMTPRGHLFYDPDYGTDIRDYLNDSFNSYIVNSQIRNELMKDERVSDVAVSSSFNADSQTLSIQIKVTDNEGDFNLTLSVSSVDYKLFIS